MEVADVSEREACVGLGGSPREGKGESNACATSSAKVGLTDLPDELISLIFCKLDYRSLARAEECCRRFRLNGKIVEEACVAMHAYILQLHFERAARTQNQVSSLFGAENQLFHTFIFISLLACLFLCSTHHQQQQLTVLLLQGTTYFAAVTL